MHIERIIARVTRYSDARHARGYGLKNADDQVKMAAMAYNLKRWHKIMRERKKAQRYQPPVTMLMTTHSLAVSCIRDIIYRA